MEKEVYDIYIDKKLIKGIPRRIDIDKILYDDENPRIAMYKESELLGTGAKTLTQAQIAFALECLPAYRELRNSIKEAGGALVPIYVYEEEGKFKVIEGNTRLFIYNKLRKEEEGIKYNKINCIVFSTKIADEVKNFVRLTCHLRGHTDWDRYEQAKYLYVLYNEEKYPMQSLAKKTKLSTAEIKQDIEAYQIMQEQFYEKHGKSDPSYVHKFSYFKEFVKDKKLKYVMEDLNLSSEDFCDWVGTKKIERAMDVRKLRNVLNNKHSFEMFIKKDLDRALEVLKEIVPEKSQKLYILMEELNQRVNKLDFEEIQEISSEESKKRKIVEKLYNKLKQLLKV